MKLKKAAKIVSEGIAFVFTGEVALTNRRKRMVSDSEAIYSDWQAVGNDIISATQKILRKDIVNKEESETEVYQ